MHGNMNNFELGHILWNFYRQTGHMKSRTRTSNLDWIQRFVGPIITFNVIEVQDLKDISSWKLYNIIMDFLVTSLYALFNQ